MTAAAIAATTQKTTSGPTASNRVLEMGNDIFLKLLLAELRNQDPLSPMDNHQLLQQIAQLRAVESNLQLTRTLEAVMRGQALQTAAGLIGREIEGLSDEGQVVSGKVERITLDGAKPKLVVRGEMVTLENIRSVAGTTESGNWWGGILG